MYRRKNPNKKPMALLLAVTLLVGCVAGGTIAWLTDKSNEVVNTFTVGDINIELKETTGAAYHFVPNQTLAKDPTVTVKADSEACYLFVKVVVANNNATDPDDSTIEANPIVNFDIADGWKSLTSAGAEAATPHVADVNGTYYFYRNVSAADAKAGKTYGVLKDNQVTISKLVTKGMVAAINDTTKPTVTFEAAAVQSANIGGLTGAWGALPTAFKP